MRTKTDSTNADRGLDHYNNSRWEYMHYLNKTFIYLWRDEIGETWDPTRKEAFRAFCYQVQEHFLDTLRRETEKYIKWRLSQKVCILESWADHVPPSDYLPPLTNSSKQPPLNFPMTPIGMVGFQKQQAGSGAAGGGFQSHAAPSVFGQYHPGQGGIGGNAQQQAVPSASIPQQQQQYSATPVYTNQYVQSPAPMPQPRQSSNSWTAEQPINQNMAPHPAQTNGPPPNQWGNTQNPAPSSRSSSGQYSASRERSGNRRNRENRH